MVRNPPKGKLEPVLQRERNCNYYDRSSIAEKEKLQLLRPLQYCKQQETAITTTAPLLRREGNCNYHDRSSVAERKKLKLLQPLLYCGERDCNYCDPSVAADHFRKQTFQAAYDPFEFCRICSFSSIQNPGRCPDSEGAAGLNWACVVFPAVNSPILGICIGTLPGALLLPARQWCRDLSCHDLSFSKGFPPFTGRKSFSALFLPSPEGCRS